MEASIALKEVSRRYGESGGLRRLSFGVEKGTVFAVVGPSGAGKSILLRILTTLTKPDSGTIYIHGLNMEARSRQIRQMCGYVPEQNTLDPDSTLYENFRTHGLLFGLSSKVAESQSKQLLERFSLAEYAHELPEVLSYGQLRQALFARALIHQPKILYMDEPVANVDSITQRNIWDFINEKRGKMTFLFTTRDMHTAEEFADRILILHQGNRITLGTPQEIRQAAFHASQFTIRFKSVNPEFFSILENIREVKHIEQHGRTYVITLIDPREIAEVTKHLDFRQVEQVSVREPSLRDFLFHLTEATEPIE